MEIYRAQQGMVFRRKSDGAIVGRRLRLDASDFLSDYEEVEDTRPKEHNSELRKELELRRQERQERYEERIKRLEEIRLKRKE